MTKTHLVVVVWMLALCCPSARADKGGLAKKAAEFVVQRWGAKAAGSITALAQRIEALAARHGHEAIEAVKRLGPRTFQIVEGAGAHGKDAVRLIATHGEHAVAWVLSRPKAMNLFVQHGDKAAAALIKHPGIAEPLVGQFGMPAIHALEAVGAQGGRRIAMLAEGGELAKFGKMPEILDIIGKTGGKALDFVWSHKGALATTAALTAFLREPEAFISGAKDLAGIVGDNLVKPVAQIPGAVATEVARGTNWTLIFLSVGAVGLLLVAGKLWPNAKRLRSTSQPTSQVIPQAEVRVGHVPSETPASVERVGLWPCQPSKKEE